MQSFDSRGQLQVCPPKQPKQGMTDSGSVPEYLLAFSMLGLVKHMSLAQAQGTHTHIQLPVCRHTTSKDCAI